MYIYIGVVVTRCSKKLLGSTVNNVFVTVSEINFLHVSDNRIVSITSKILTFYSAVYMYPFSAFSYVTLYYF